MVSNKTVIYFSSSLKNLAELSGREKDILVNRLKGQTLEKIGADFELSEARIRQIEKSAITKLRNKFKQLALFKANFSK